MRPRINMALLAGMIVVALVAFAACRGDRGITTSGFWARANVDVGMHGMGSSATSAIYGTIRGSGDRLTGATVPSSVAALAELHKTVVEGGIARMQPVAAAELSGTLTLAPGGMHVMLFDLAAPLKPGDRFDVTLHFEHAGDRSVSVDVRAEAP